LPLAIRARELTKRFPKPNGLIGVTLPFAQAEGTLAVDRVSLDVEQGEVFGLVGPNGAGKTTLVKMLTTLILPTSGTAVIGGHPLDGAHEQRIKGWIGLVTGNERSFYPRLSCRENLAFYAGLYDLSRTETAERVAELAELLELEAFLDKRYDTCSTGMKHRLALARSLINRPALLFLDEPTRSLDPLAAARFRQAIHALARRERRTVFLVTHDLEEAVGVLDQQKGDLQPEVAHAQNKAKQLAHDMAGRIPIIVGVGPLAPVARRWKTQFNENAKAWSYFEVLPEMDHNALSGIEFPPEATDWLYVLFFRYKGLHPRMQMRINLTHRIFGDRGIVTRQVDIPGQSALAQIMAGVQLGDYASCYAALLHQTDPTEIGAIEGLKKDMAGQ